MRPSVPRRSWRLRVEDTLQAITRIRDYVADYDLDGFCADQRTIDAVVRNLEIVGEASRHVPSEVQQRYPSLPWTEMRAMRNLLSHAYFLVDLEIVWKTVRDDLPKLEPALAEILNEEP